VGDFLLKDLLDEDSMGNFQDWRAEHSKLPGNRVRIRTDGNRKNATTGELESLKRTAHREYNLGSNLTHPWVLQVRQCTETEFGPAVIFQHSGESLRFDHHLREHGPEPSLDQRFHLIRGIAEGGWFAHGKWAIHRVLSLQSLFLDSTSDNFYEVSGHSLAKKGAVREINQFQRADPLGNHHLRGDGQGNLDSFSRAGGGTVDLLTENESSKIVRPSPWRKGVPNNIPRDLLIEFGTQTMIIPRGSPLENPFIESFN
jgi:serine/threonine protein kinase